VQRQAQIFHRAYEVIGDVPYAVAFANILAILIALGHFIHLGDSSAEFFG
jgi:hypothetical protein